MSFILRNWSLVKIGTTQLQRKLFYSLSKLRKQIGDGKGMGEDNTKLLAESLGTSESEIIDIENRIQHRDYSMNAPIEEEGGETFLVQIADDSANPSELLEEGQLKDQIQERLQSLWPRFSEREKFLIEKRLYAENPITLQEVGDHYGITRERVRQIEERLKKKLRENFSDLQEE